MSETHIGKKYPRPDSFSKVTGSAMYTGDIFEKRRDVLIAKVKRIDCPAARIISIDAEAARNYPGVVAVLTAEDVPNRGLYGYTIHEKPVVAVDETVCDSDPVAIVAAESEEAAEEAIKLIKVEYEPLEYETDPRKSGLEGAKSIHKNHPVSKQSNISNTARVARGNVDQALESSAVVLHREFRTPMVEHACLELDIAVAEPDFVNGGLTFYCPVQNIHSMRNGLSRALELPISKIRVISTLLGGGFGGKECSSVDCGAVAGILALKTKRAVKYEMTREEVFRHTSKRHRSYTTYRIGADSSGKLTGIKAESLFDKGAYKSVDVIPHRSAVLASGAYYVPAADVFNKSVFTNHVYGGAFRGLGAPQQHYALECAIDDLALTMGMDPIDFRLKNIIKQGETTIFAQVMAQNDEAGIRECLLKVREAMNWDVPLDNSHPYLKRGRGVACYMYGTGTSFANDAGHVYMELNGDGSLNVNVAQNEMGQGMIVALSQIAAEAMGIPVESVNIGMSDSASAPESGPTSASRTTVFQGNAIIAGCTELKERMFKVAAQVLGEDAAKLDIKDGVIFSTVNGEKTLALKQAVLAARAKQVSVATVGNWYPEKAVPDPTKLNQTSRWSAFAYGAHGVEVEVDTRTGMITVTRSVHATDVGRAINPSAVEGQMDGGTAQAFGWALMEENRLKGGRIGEATFHEYLIPTAMDMPKLESIIVESQSEKGPYGAKGIGEPVILGGAPAIRNAVLNATGVALYEIPMTPVRVMAALEAQAKASPEEKTPYFSAPLE